jgi:DinB superfamily
MRKLASLLLAVMVAAPLFAQSKNPVTDSARQMLQGRAKNMTAAAEEMPADKYSFKPTPAQETFGHMQLHIVESNNSLCSAVGGTASAEDKDLKDTDPKDKIVAAMRRSFDVCTKVLGAMTDANLQEGAKVFGRDASKGAALLYMASGWGDHYASQAMYLRLNGLLPPTAQKKAEKKEEGKKEKY